MIFRYVIYGLLAIPMLVDEYVPGTVRALQINRDNVFYHQLGGFRVDLPP